MEQLFLGSFYNQEVCTLLRTGVPWIPSTCKLSAEAMAAGSIAHLSSCNNNNVPSSLLIFNNNNNNILLLIPLLLLYLFLLFYFLFFSIINNYYYNTVKFIIFNHSIHHPSSSHIKIKNEEDFSIINNSVQVSNTSLHILATTTGQKNNDKVSMRL